MDLKASVGILIILYVCTFVQCDKHTKGADIFKGEPLLFEELLNRNTSEPTNYTIIFNYKSSPLEGTLTFIEFDINCNSTAEIEWTSASRLDSDENNTVSATIHVINGTDVRATVGLYGSIGARKILSVVREQTFMTGLFADKRWKPRSFAFVYAHSSGKSRNRIVSMGKRQPNDKLLYFKSKLVRKSNRFAEDEFQVQDNDYSITKVTFTFSSPTAIAFINSTFIDEHGINAIVYDLGRDRFRADMSVWGYDMLDKPADYKPIIAIEKTNYLMEIS